MPEIVPRLGQLLDGEQGRDAIHIAIAPVVAGEELFPGQHIGFAGPGDCVTVVGVPPGAGSLGIVDPYLRQRVFLGDRFYMFLYPQTITGLRHEWTHPAFPLQADINPDAIETVEITMPRTGRSERLIVPRVESAPASTPLRSHAEQWLRAFANEWGFDFRTMIADASHGRSLVANSESFEDSDKQRFFDMLQVYTDRVFDENQREETYFSCSC